MASPVFGSPLSPPDALAHYYTTLWVSASRLYTSRTSCPASPPCNARWSRVHARSDVGRGGDPAFWRWAGFARTRPRVIPPVGMSSGTARLVIPATLTVVAMSASCTGGAVVFFRDATVEPTATDISTVATDTPIALTDLLALTDTGSRVDVAEAMDTAAATDTPGPVDTGSDMAFADVAHTDVSVPPEDVIVTALGLVCTVPYIIPDAGAVCGTCHAPDGSVSDCALCPTGPDGGLETLC